jgi:hypothetical protein
MQNDENIICAICLENIIYNKDMILILSCNHQFHYKCIKKIIKITTICPICRKINRYEDKCEYCKYTAKMEYENKKYCMNHYNNIMLFEIRSKNIDIQKILNES